MTARRGMWAVRAAALAAGVTALAVGCTVDARTPLPATTTTAPAPPPVDAPGVYVVSPRGDDAARGGVSAPWRTVAYAIGRLRPGDELFLRAGRYVEDVVGVDIAQGTSDAGITVTAWPGESPVLVGLLWLEEPTYWSISGLRITWADGNDSDDHMVKLVGGTDWDFVGNELWGARSYAALLVAGDGRRPARWRVVGNCIHDTVPTNETNQDQLIYANPGVGAGPGLIAENVLFGAPNGAGVKLGGPDRDSGGASDVLVARNTIVDTAQSVLVSWRSRDNRIEGNLLYGTGEGYGNIRGYELDDDSNEASGNAGGGAERLLMNDEGHGEVVDAGGNVFPVDPELASISCDDHRPANPVARPYGAGAGAVEPGP